MSLEKSDFELIYNDYHKLVRSIIFRSLGSTEIDELTQVTFMKVFEKYDSLKEKDKLKSWICSITVNLIRDHIRKKSSVSWLSFFKVEDYEVVDEKENLEALFELNDVVTEINKLSRSLKEVIVLYSFDELKLSEIAHILKIPLGTVKSRLHEARVLLKEQIKIGGDV